MPHIRIRFHYNTVTLNEHGVIDGHKSICGSTVEVLGTDGSTERFNFKGFRAYSNYRNSLLPVQFVKVWNVSAFYKNDFAKAEYVNANHYCIGVFEANDNGVYLLLDGEALMTRNANRVARAPKNIDNVVPFPRQDKKH